MQKYIVPLVICYVALEMLNIEFCIVLQAELMFDTIREWPHYVKLPFSVAKASTLLHILMYILVVDIL